MRHEEENQELIRQVWPQFTITRRLGAGGFGAVYEVVEKVLGLRQHSAVKVIRFPNSDELAAVKASTDLQSKDELRTFYKPTLDKVLNEILLMERLKTSGAVVTIQDYRCLERENPFCYVVLIRMECLENLQNYIKRKQIPAREVVQMGIDMARALEICHKENILHRDVKESNIFRSEHGTYKLGDFGISRHLEASNNSLSRKGTTGYMAPEMLRGERYNFTVDIYALGMVLYRLLNQKRLPFCPIGVPLTQEILDEANERRLSGEPLPPPKDAAPELAEIICRACAPNPQDRYPTARSFLEDLQVYDVELKKQGGENSDESLNEASVEAAAADEAEAVPDGEIEPAPEPAPEDVAPQAESSSPKGKEGKQSCTLSSTAKSAGAAADPYKYWKIGFFSLGFFVLCMAIALAFVIRKLPQYEKAVFSTTNSLTGSRQTEKSADETTDRSAIKATTVAQQSKTSEKNTLNSSKSAKATTVATKAKTFAGKGKIPDLKDHRYVEITPDQGEAMNTYLNGGRERKGTYIGSLDSKGKPHGYGAFSSQNPQGHKWIYSGEWEHGIMRGKGIQVFHKYDENALEVYWDGEFDGELVEGRVSAIAKDFTISNWQGTFHQEKITQGTFIRKALSGAWIYEKGDFDKNAHLYRGILCGKNVSTTTGEAEYFATFYEDARHFESYFTKPGEGLTGKWAKVQINAGVSGDPVEISGPPDFWYEPTDEDFE